MTSTIAQSRDSVKTETRQGTIPIPFEAFVSDQGLLMQVVTTKKLTPTSRFGVFVLSEFYGDFNRERKNDEFITQTYLTYEIIRGLSATAGGAINHVSGFSPSVGVQVAMPFKDFFLLLSPRYETANNRNAEILGFLEYKPAISGKWGIYSRVQALYAHNTAENLHEISYIRLRLGASYKTFKFGLGSNHMSYGPMKHREDFYGIFARALLF